MSTKDAELKIRLSSKEKADLLKAAKAENISMSEYMRRYLPEYETDTTANSEA